MPTPSELLDLIKNGSESDIITAIKNSSESSIYDSYATMLQVSENYKNGEATKEEYYDAMLAFQVTQEMFLLNKASDSNPDLSTVVQLRNYTKGYEIDNALQQRLEEMGYSPGKEQWLSAQDREKLHSEFGEILYNDTFIPPITPGSHLIVWHKTLEDGNNLVDIKNVETALEHEVVNSIDWLNREHGIYLSSAVEQFEPLSFSSLYMKERLSEDGHVISDELQADGVSFACKDVKNPDICEGVKSVQNDWEQLQEDAANKFNNLLDHIWQGIENIEKMIPDIGLDQHPSEPLGQKMGQTIGQKMGQKK